jgi:hypothetical protein
MKMKLLISAALAMVAIRGYALNPIIQTIYTADPAPVVHDGVCYLVSGRKQVFFEKQIPARLLKRA